MEVALAVRLGRGEDPRVLDTHTTPPPPLPQGTSSVKLGEQGVRAAPGAGQPLQGRAPPWESGPQGPLVT